MPLHLAALTITFKDLSKFILNDLLNIPLKRNPKVKAGQDDRDYL